MNIIMLITEEQLQIFSSHIWQEVSFPDVHCKGENLLQQANLLPEECKAGISCYLHEFPKVYN